MSYNYKEFITAAMEDSDLKSQIDNIIADKIDGNDDAHKDMLNRIVALANDNGFELTLDDFAIDRPTSEENDELSAISGNTSCGAENQYYEHVRESCGNASFTDWYETNLDWLNY